MTVLDCVGNEVTSEINVTRDLNTPELTILGFNNLISSPSNKINVNITDNYPITSMFVNVSNYSGSVTACTSNCEFFMWEKMNVAHGQQGYITVYATTSTERFSSPIKHLRLIHLWLHPLLIPQIL